MGSMGGYLALSRSCSSLLPQLVLATAEMPVAAGAWICMRSSIHDCRKDEDDDDADIINTSRNNHNEQNK